MAAITLSAAAKKIAAALASDEKGRKTIWYAIGIAIFILLIPIIVVYCLFGWMADCKINLEERMNFPEMTERVASVSFHKWQLLKSEMDFSQIE